MDSVDKAGEFLTWLSQRRPNDMVGLDLETGELPGRDSKDALSPWRGRIRLIQIGDAMQGWAIPWEGWSGVFQQGFKNFNGQVVCHNIAFEAKWLELHSGWKIPWAYAHDTMIQSQIVNPAAKRHGLKPLSEEFIDRQSANLQDDLHQGFHDNGWTWGTVPIDYKPYWLYGALDPVMTVRLWEMFNEKTGKGKQFERPYEIEMNALRIATRMELNGARVDLEYSQKKLDEFNAYTEQVAGWVADNFDKASVTSNIQMVRVFEGLGQEITEFTKSGGRSLNDDQLTIFERSDDKTVSTLATIIQKHRKAAKLASSYFANFINYNNNGIVHPEIKTTEARTGRMSITNPALQTLPSKDPTVRRVFIPRVEGNKIISSDLDQVEFRLTANFSRDQNLIDVFNEADRTGGDVFTTIMRQVYADPTLDKERDSNKRKLIKNVVYGKLYGAGTKRMAFTAGVPLAQMQTVVDDFDSAYPKIKTFQRDIEMKGTQRLVVEGEGYVVTPNGRRLPADADRIYALTNYLVQASAAEVFKLNLIKLDQQDLTDHLIVPVHDEIVLEASPEEAPEVMAIVKQCMTTAGDEWAVPLSAGVDGPFDNWGQKYEMA